MPPIDRDPIGAVASRAIDRAGLVVSELGFGAAPLGNLYQSVSDDAARRTLETALTAGIGYVDTAPHYGFGLSERRVGDVLRQRRGYVLSSKVGRLLEPVRSFREDEDRLGFRTPMPFEPVFDYSYDGVLRSHQDSLQRLGLSRIDILYVHDIGARTHRVHHAQRFDQLTLGGGFRALEELRRAGDIAALGLGVNEWEICVRASDYADLDVVLLAGRYTLIEQGALEQFFPMCERRNISVVVGGPFNSGILATGVRSGREPHYDYGPPSSGIIARVARIEAICEAHGVALAAAALQFPLAHKSVVSVIPGADHPDQVAAAVRLYRAPIPQVFWEELKAQGLIAAEAPVPGAPPP